MLKKSFPILFLLFLFSISSYAQRNLIGTVVEIVDGRTVMVQDKPNSLIKVRLQGIEVPEASQPLAEVVKEHLGKMLLGKNVRLQMNDLNKGKITVNGIDASGQLLRDGAAWFDLPERRSLSQVDSEMYLELESAAKTDKLGVWSVENLKPSWEFRAEQEAIRKQEAEIALKKQQEENQKNASKTKVRPMNQYDLSVNLSNSSQPPANNKPKPDEEGEWETYVPNKSSEIQVDSKYLKTIEAVEEMQNLMAGLLGGDSLKDFQQRLGAVKVKVALARDVLPKDDLRVLMEKNVELLADLEWAMNFIITKKLPGIEYKGEGVKFAQDYGITPVRAKNGKFILERNDIFYSLSDSAMKNLLAIKRIIDAKK